MAAPHAVFKDLFLRVEDVREGMRSVQSPGEVDPKRDSIFACLGGPGGKESGLSEWGDPDGREALWRLSDLRWGFDDDAAAEAFRQKTMKHFEGKHFKVTACEVSLGDGCARIFNDEPAPDGTAHTEVGFLFRVGRGVLRRESSRAFRSRGRVSVTPPRPARRTCLSASALSLRSSSRRARGRATRRR